MLTANAVTATVQLPNRTHIVGASGSGTTSLAAETTRRYGYRHPDTDDYYGLRTVPPYCETRPAEERLALLRDLLALNKLEVSPWDTWRLATKDDDALTDAHLVSCDRIAAVTQGDDVDLAQILALYETVEEVHLPPWLR